MFDAELLWTSSVLILILNHWMWFSLDSLSIVCSFKWALGLSTFGTEEAQKHSIIQNSLRSKISEHNFLNSWVTQLYKKLCFFSSSPLRISELMNDGKSSKENGVWIYEIGSNGITKLLRPLSKYKVLQYLMYFISHTNHKYLNC